MSNVLVRDLPGHRTLYKPKSHAPMEYNGGLEKAIPRGSDLPVQQ